MTAAIILAAGESRRMGTPKATLPLRGGTFLSVLSETLGRFCNPVVAVFGAGGSQLIQNLPPGVHGALNPEWKQGMLTSLQQGIRALPEQVESLVFTLVDHPAVKPGTVQALLREPDRVVIPRCDGRRGHPVLMRHPLFDEILAEPTTSQIRDIVNRHAGDVRYVEVNDPGIFDDIDDPRLYQSLLEREQTPEAQGQ